MLNRTTINVGIISAIGAGLCTALFAIFIIIGADMYSYFICLLLSIFYLVMSVSNNSIVKDSNKMISNIAVVFAVIYCTLICIVYYTQISFVRLGNPSKEALSVVAYFPPKTAFFAIDILGYTFLALSTLFIAFSIEKNKILKIILIIHGIVGTLGFITPLLPYFYEMQENSSDNTDSIALFSWCILFISICFLFAKYFINKLKEK